MVLRVYDGVWPWVSSHTYQEFRIRYMAGIKNLGWGMISRVQDEVYVYFRMGCGIQSSG